MFAEQGVQEHREPALSRCGAALTTLASRAAEAYVQLWWVVHVGLGMHWQPAGGRRPSRSDAARVFPGLSAWDRYGLLGALVVVALVGLLALVARAAPSC